MALSSRPDPLAQLASRLGLETSYHSWRGDPVVADRDTLSGALAALGHPVRTADDATAALHELDRQFWADRAPPVVVAWDGVELDLPLRVPADVDGQWRVELALESGGRVERHGTLFHLQASDHAYPGGQVHCLRHARVPVGELGYHRLRWSVGGSSGEALVIAAPVRAWGAPGTLGKRWGVFAPVYALRGARSGGAGDLGTLAALRAAVARRGGSYVATLPILAAFLDEPMQASPYSPASRLFWNELYLDLDRAPGIEAAPAARARLDAPAVVAERAALAALPLIDYRRQYAWRRSVIDELAAAAWGGALAGELAAFARGRALDYAMFRALGEAERAPWRAWPAARQALAAPRDLDAAVAAGADRRRMQVHLYAQWAMDRQLSETDPHDREHAGLGEAGLYLDLPVGVNADAYEVWRDRDLFMLGAAAGAPPDELFLGGQDWGLPPLHPERSRQSGHRYFVECIRHHMRHAAMLRIDHVMGLHRLYCVPAGRSAKQGIYLRYPADELYAIVTLESHRHQCAVVGEDLGTVPDYVRPMMTQHGLSRLHVAQFGMPRKPGDGIDLPPAESVAGLNTHDTPTFSGWWHGCDIEDRLDLDLIGEVRAAEERQERAVTRRALVAHLDRHRFAPAPAPAAVSPAGRRRPTTGSPGIGAGEDPADERRALLGAHAELAAGPAHVVLVSIEDLWLEPKPQNVPGTSDERPNWRRPATRTVEQLVADPDVAAALDDVARRRPV